MPRLTGGRDVVLRIAGPHLEEPVPGVLNLAWIISPPNIAPWPRLRRFDVVFACSEAVVRRLTYFGVDAVYLPQATNTRKFSPAAHDPEQAWNSITFVGNRAARAPRGIVSLAINSGLEVSIWGKGWENEARPGQWKGKVCPPEKLAGVYAASHIVINSHMPEMARLGMMSNRSFDALASGAAVISDVVEGFDDPALPDLIQVSTRAGLVQASNHLLDLARSRPELRQARHDRIAARYSFEARADTLLAKADACLRMNAAGRRDRPYIFLGETPGKLAASHPAITAAGIGILGDLGKLSPSQIETWRPDRTRDRGSVTGEGGVIHPLLHDVRKLNDLAGRHETARAQIEADRLTARARRVIEALVDDSGPFSLTRSAPSFQDAALARLADDLPLFGTTPTNFSRDAMKTHLRLTPRRNPVRLGRPFGIFLHLYYQDLAPIFAECLSRVDAPHALYISTDSEAKAAHISQVLPAAELRVFENRGRDIYPKFYGFGDAYVAHDIVLHLHSKKSRHFGDTNEWLAHILDCILGSTETINRILSLFASVPRLGLVAPVVTKEVLSAAHWAANRAIAQELAARTDPPMRLPPDAELRFPVGSMFWARSAAIRPLLDLHLPQVAFHPERGQLDGTVAHALERLVGVACTETGHHMISVAGPDSKIYRKYGIVLDNNKQLEQHLPL
jgi:hypothetical protein